jgi:hypothetical protein
MESKNRQRRRRREPLRCERCDSVLRRGETCSYCAAGFGIVIETDEGPVLYQEEPDE